MLKIALIIPIVIVFGCIAYLVKMMMDIPESPFDKEEK